MEKLILAIDGMSCAACANRIEKTLSGMPDVKKAAVSFPARQAVLESDSPLSPSPLIEAVKSLGYGAAEVSRPEGADGKRLVLAIKGMHCAACSNQVEKKLKQTKGITKASVSLPQNLAYVDYVPNETDVATIIAAIEELGFAASLESESRLKSGVNSDSDKELSDSRNRMAIAWLLSLPPMALMIFGVMGHGSDGHGVSAVHLVSLAMGIAVLCWPGRATITRAFKQASRLYAGMDVLIALGTLAAVGSGILSLFGLPVVDFSMIGGMIMAFHLTGRWLEARAKSGATGEIAKLAELGAKRAMVERNGRVVEVPVEELSIGDIVQVRPGGKIPQDGVVVEGSAGVDEAIVTGESIPTRKTAGDAVTGATVNVDGFLRVKIARTGDDSFLSQIIRMVKEAQSDKVPIQAFADKVTSVFVPTVLLLAATAFALQLLAPDFFGNLSTRASAWLPWINPHLPPFSRALSAAIATLVIACPCALGLATPMALMVGLGMSAKHGVLFRNGAAVQTLKETNAVLLDKTGTITVGKPKVDKAVFADSANGDALLAVAAALEGRSEHPAAQAIAAYAGERIAGKAIARADDFAVQPGRGVSATVDGELYRIGSLSWADESNPVWLESMRREAEAAGARGMSLAVLFNDKLALGLFMLADEIRPDSRSAIERLKKSGKKAVLLTGDRQAAADRVGRELGLDRVIAEVLPGDKMSAVKKLQDEGERVVMVGDGINDAPALKQANVGIAMGTGAEVAREAGDVILVRSGLTALADAFDISAAIFAKIRQNLFWAFFYNILMIPLAFIGVLHPLIAEAAMAFSSLNVIWNSLRLNKFGRKQL